MNRERGLVFTGDAEMEGDMDYRFELDGSTFASDGRAEFPPGQRLHRVGVELRVESADELNAVHGPIFADDGVEDHFAFDVGLNQLRRIFWIHFAHRNRT